MQASHISHVSLTVENLERSLDFYRDVLGMKLLFRIREDMSSPIFIGTKKKKHHARLTAGLAFSENTLNPVLVIEEYPEHPPEGQSILLDEIGISHISFSVPDVAALGRELLAKGVPIVSPPAEAFSDTSKRLVTAFFKDPDGILVQFDQHDYGFWSRMHEKSVAAKQADRK